MRRLARSGFALLPVSPTDDLYEDEFVRQVIAVFKRAHLYIDERTAIVDQEIQDNKRERIVLMDIERKDEHIMRAIGSLHTAAKALNGKMSQIELTRQRLYVPEVNLVRARYREIMQTPRIVSVDVLDNRLVYRTDTLYGKDHAGRWRKIGRLEISFDMIFPTLDSFRWRNLDGAKGIYHGPPNIVSELDQSYGRVNCGGTDVALVINAAIKDFDYPELVAFSVRYPECAGAELTKIIEMWPIVDPSDVPEWYRNQFGS